MRVLLTTVLAGCTAPSFPIDDTVFRCDDMHACPAGYTCSVEAGVCRAENAAGCAGQALTHSWHFEIADEHWTIAAPAAQVSLVWSAADDGIVVATLEATSAAMYEAYITPPPGAYGDLSGKILSAKVWTDAANLTILPFLQSGEPGSLSRWSEPGETRLLANSWTCVVFDVDAGFRPPEFDVQHVTHVGLDIKTWLEASIPVQLHIDEVGY